MYYYTETLKIRENAKGRPRLYSDLEGLAVCAGFDGDGTKANATLRYWKSENNIDPLPEGVKGIRESEFNDGVAAREAAKPAPPEPTQRELDYARRLELREKAATEGLTALEIAEAVKLIL